MAPQAEIPELQPLEEPPEIEEIQPLPEPSAARISPRQGFFVALLFAAGLHVLVLTGFAMLPVPGPPRTGGWCVVEMQGRNLTAEERCRRDLQHRRDGLLAWRAKHGRFPRVPSETGGAGPDAPGCPSAGLRIGETVLGTGENCRIAWILGCPVHHTSVVLDEAPLRSFR